MRRCTLPGKRVVLNLIKIVGVHGRCRAGAGITVLLLSDLLVEGARGLQVQASRCLLSGAHAGTALAALRSGRLSGASAVLERVTRHFTSPAVERRVVTAGIGQDVG